MPVSLSVRILLRYGMPSEISQLTLHQKIGQLLMVGFRGAHPDKCDQIVRDIREHHIGGVILFDEEMANPSLRRRNIASPSQLRELVAHLQANAPVPLLVAIDQEGGRVNRLKATYGFPESSSHEELGRLNRPDETFRHAGTIAATLSGLGINWNLAPVVDLDVNPKNPIIKGKRRSFSPEPETVFAHASEFIKAHRAHGVLTCAKHFPGHGSATGDTHLGLVDVTKTWTDQELIPFKRLIEANLCDAIMSAHVFNAALDSELPATLSKPVLTELLRGQLGFEGVIISDDLEMKAITSHHGLERSVPAAIEAGVDVVCFGNNLSFNPDIAPRVIDILARAVESGQVQVARVDAAWQRVQRLKQKARLIP